MKTTGSTLPAGRCWTGLLRHLYGRELGRPDDVRDALAKSFAVDAAAEVALARLAMAPPGDPVSVARLTAGEDPGARQPAENGAR